MNVLDWDKPSWMTARCPKHLILKFLVFAGASPHMEPRLAFLIGVVVTQVFNQRPVQLDQAELILLKNEIAHTRASLDEYHTIQAECKWNERVQGLVIRANLIFDVLILIYFLGRVCGRRPTTPPLTRPNTGGSSDSEGPDTVPGCEKTISRTGVRDRQLALVKSRPTRPSDLK